MALPKDGVLTRYFVNEQWIKRVADAASRIGITPTGTVSVTGPTSTLTFLTLDTGDLIYKDRMGHLAVLRAPTDKARYILGIIDEVPTWVPEHVAQTIAQRQHILGTTKRHVL